MNTGQGRHATRKLLIGLSEKAVTAARRRPEPEEPYEGTVPGELSLGVFL